MSYTSQILHGELQDTIKGLEERLETTSAELQKQKDLNEKLEEDLLSINQRGPSTPAKQSSKSKGKAPAINGIDQDILDSDDLLAGLDLGKKSIDASTRATPIPFAPSADTSILPIVTSQRDRFRQRNAELEDELRKQYQTISELRAEIKSLQADNLKLYEKVRYMQSYREDASGSTLGVGGVGGRSPSPLGMSRYPSAGTEHGREDSVSKYQSRYEETINPFEAFRGRVRPSATLRWVFF